MLKYGVLLLWCLSVAQARYHIRSNAASRQTITHHVGHEERTVGIVVEMPDSLPDDILGESVVFEIPAAEYSDLVGTVTRVQSSPTSASRTLSGVLNDGGEFVVTCGMVAAHVSCVGNIRPHNMPHAQYELRADKNHVHSMRAVDTSVYEKGDTRELPQKIAKMAAARKERKLGPVVSDTNDILDVMVVYTDDALSEVGDAATMALRIKLAVDESNTILENSKVDLRLRVVNYKKSADSFSDPSMSDLLLKATYSGSGYTELDSDQLTRKDVGADVLHVVKGTDSSSCGLAWPGDQASDSVDYAISVSGIDCFTGYYSFLHEIAHNLGANHDVANADSADSFYTYSYGHCWDSGDCATCHRSVMAYSGCTTVAAVGSVGQCTDCTRVAYLSNPNVIESGQSVATGTVDHDNARTLNGYKDFAVSLIVSNEEGGIVFSLTPSSMKTNTCGNVVIKGWRIGTGSDITDVSLAGVDVLSIVSQTEDTVEVIADSYDANVVGDVSITAGGITTTLVNGFQYDASSNAGNVQCPAPTSLPTAGGTNAPVSFSGPPVAAPTGAPVSFSGPPVAAPTGAPVSFSGPPVASPNYVSATPTAATDDYFYAAPTQAPRAKPTRKPRSLKILKPTKKPKGTPTKKPSKAKLTKAPKVKKTRDKGQKDKGQKDKGQKGQTGSDEAVVRTKRPTKAPVPKRTKRPTKAPAPRKKRKVSKKKSKASAVDGSVDTDDAGEESDGYSGVAVAGIAVGSVVAIALLYRNLFGNAETAEPEKLNA